MLDFWALSIILGEYREGRLKNVWLRNDLICDAQNNQTSVQHVGQSIVISCPNTSNLPIVEPDETLQVLMSPGLMAKFVDNEHLWLSKVTIDSILYKPPKAHPHYDQLLSELYDPVPWDITQRPVGPHRKLVEKSKWLGCYDGLHAVRALDIKEWCGIDDNTAICPQCWTDALLPDALGPHVLDYSFLSEANQAYFSGDKVQREDYVVVDVSTFTC